MFSNLRIETIHQFENSTQLQLQKLINDINAVVLIDDLPSFLLNLEQHFCILQLYSEYQPKFQFTQSYAQKHISYACKLFQDEPVLLAHLKTVDQVLLYHYKYYPVLLSKSQQQNFQNVNSVSNFFTFSNRVLSARVVSYLTDDINVANYTMFPSVFALIIDLLRQLKLQSLYYFRTVKQNLPQLDRALFDQFKTRTSIDYLFYVSYCDGVDFLSEIGTITNIFDVKYQDALSLLHPLYNSQSRTVFIKSPNCQKTQTIKVGVLRQLNNHLINSKLQSFSDNQLIYNVQLNVCMQGDTFQLSLLQLIYLINKEFLNSNQLHLVEYELGQRHLGSSILQQSKIMQFMKLNQQVQLCDLQKLFDSKDIDQLIQRDLLELDNQCVIYQ